MSSAPKDTIVVAISDQPHSDFAFNWFVKYFMKPNQHIALVTVVKSPLETEFFTSSIGLGDNPIVYTPENIEKIKKQLTDNGYNMLKKYSEKIHTIDKKIQVTCVVEVGDARDGILDAVEKMNAMALVIGSRGLSSLKRAFLGSTSDYCVHHAHCPVLVVKDVSQRKPAAAAK